MECLDAQSAMSKGPCTETEQGERREGSRSLWSQVRRRHLSPCPALQSPALSLALEAGPHLTPHRGEGQDVVGRSPRPLRGGTGDPSGDGEAPAGSACAAQSAGSGRRPRPGTRAYPAPEMSQWPQTLTSLRCHRGSCPGGHNACFPEAPDVPPRSSPPPQRNSVLPDAGESCDSPQSAGGPDQQERHGNLSDMQVLRPVRLEQAPWVGPAAFQQLGVQGLLAGGPGPSSVGGQLSTGLMAPWKGHPLTWQENQPSGVQSRPPALAPLSK